MTEPRRRAYVKQFSRASTLLANQRVSEGRYPEAIALVEEVLQPSVDIDNIDAKRLTRENERPGLLLAKTNPFSPRKGPSGQAGIEDRSRLHRPG